MTEFWDVFDRIMRLLAAALVIGSSVRVLRTGKPDLTVVYWVTLAAYMRASS